MKKLKIPVLDNIDDLTQEELDFLIEHWHDVHKKNRDAYERSSEIVWKLVNEALTRNQKHYDEGK